MAGVPYQGPHVFYPLSGTATSASSKRVQIGPVRPPTPSVHVPTRTPSPAKPSVQKIGGHSVCADCGNGGGTNPPSLPPRDQVATSEPGPLGSSSGITHQTPPTTAGVTDFGSGIKSFGGSVAAAPPNVSVAAAVPTPAAPEPTSNNAALTVAAAAVGILILGAIFL